MNKLDETIVNFMNYNARDVLYNLVQYTSLNDVIEGLLDYYSNEPSNGKYILSTEKSNVIISEDRIVIVNK